MGRMQNLSLPPNIGALEANSAVENEKPSLSGALYTIQTQLRSRKRATLVKPTRSGSIHLNQRE